MTSETRAEVPPPLAGGDPTVEGRPAGLGYQPALDGLRAFAVIAVLCYHGGVSWAAGGYLGVDAFFVLSGFLITALLLEEHRRHGRIDLVGFFTRRARRLLPAVMVLVVGIGLYAAWFAPASQVRSIRSDAFATLGYVANWRLVASPAGYFDLFATPSPLRHAWSLAVEEQWYLIWPLVLVGILAACRARARLVVVVVAGLALASALWTAVLASPGEDPSRVYYGTDTRAHELLVGAALAIVVDAALRRRSRDALGRGSGPMPWWERGLHGAALVAVVFTMVCWAVVGGRSPWLYEGGLLLLATAVALVIASALHERSPLRPVLQWRPLVLIGLISYSLYLWHWPIYLVLTPSRTGLAGTELFVTRLVVATVVAAASYLLVEQPIRGAAPSGLRLVALLVAGATVAGLAVMAGTRGAVSVDDPLQARTQSRSVVSPRAPAPDASVPDSVATPGARPLRPPRVFVVGDSVALTITPGIERVGGDRIVLGNNTVLGCGLVPGELVGDQRPTSNTERCAAWRAQWQADVVRFQPDALVLFSGIWDAYDHEADGRRYTFGTRAYAAWYEAQMQAIIDAVPPSVTSIVLLSNPCYRAVNELGTSHANSHVFDTEQLAWFNGLIRRVSATNPGRVRLVDLHRAACPNGRYVGESGGTVLRYDGVHFTSEGADVIAAALVPELLEAAGPSGA